MKKKHTFILSAAIIILLSSYSFSVDLNVNPSQGFSGIQIAIDKANSGDRIILSSGTYKGKKTITIARKANIKLIGKGRVSLICTSTENDVIEVVISGKIELRNLHVTHEPAAEGCAGNVISIKNSSEIGVINCNINGCGVIGINLSHCSKIVIYNNKIHNNSYAGISAANANEIFIASNRIINNKHSGAIFHLCKDIELSVNIFSGNKVKNVWGRNSHFKIISRNTPSKINRLKKRNPDNFSSNANNTNQEGGWN
jgi:hypothetical protein